ncbi:MAG: hypothetical protein COA96_10400 [SAR86 cluster bacterium]|uniref:Head protein n=1 Tax=SAR86 cluster bacterium TaxID=2030880 RepID=A0A2A5AXW3_9GAMM|nr:MAG: hypothetical protein COA96_10400 [SAR86 cluster bacterium]
MANNFDSNITRKLARVFLEKFESKRVMSKNVNTQLLKGQFDPSSGTRVDFKRPTDYKSTRTSDGDISSTTAQDIITGKATGTVQDYITVEVAFSEAAQSIEMDQLDDLLDPMATRIVTDLELDFAGYMMRNSALLAGVHGQGVGTWEEVAEAGAVMESAGIPKDGNWFYSCNPYTQRSLSGVQRSLGAGEKLVMSSHEMATITPMFAGMSVMTATTLASYTSPASTDLVGAVNGTPNVSYLAAKDTMTQTIVCDGFTDSLTLKAGQMVRITGRNRLNLNTRQPVITETGATVVWTATLAQDAVMTGGAVTLVLTGPAIYEANGAYNTTDSAVADNDVITILGAASTLYQPNLFWHKQAFSIGSVPIAKLYSTDTLATTEDGLQIRVSKGTSFRENKQMVRFDLRPAFATLNPFFSGQGFGAV